MYKRILVPIDGSPTSSRGLNEAIALAKLTGGHIKLVHVVDTHMAYIDYSGMSNIGDLINMLREAGGKVLEQARRVVESEDVPVNATLVECSSGAIAEAILIEVKQYAAELVVMGTHGRRGVRHLVMGSDAESVLRQCDVPVLLVRCPA
ncbi:MAG: universal stress protein [Burkholderiales bacterium]|nr:universal stress protein [Burkholderiales bacterium]